MNELYPINKTDVLRYLRCEKSDSKTDLLIDECSEELRTTANPRFLYRVFPISFSDHSDSYENSVNVEGTSLKFCGSDILKHLENCNRVILSVATLGAEVDRVLRKLSATDLGKSVVFDSCASSMIESVLSFNQAKLRKEYNEKQKFITSAFSPGYGNLSIDIQKKFLDVIDAGRKIGVFATTENLLCPHKSITSITGVSDIPVFGTLASCKHCVLKEKCEFRSRGTTCYNNEKCE